MVRKLTLRIVQHANLATAKKHLLWQQLLMQCLEIDPEECTHRVSIALGCMQTTITLIQHSCQLSKLDYVGTGHTPPQDHTQIINQAELLCSDVDYVTPLPRPY